MRLGSLLALTLYAICLASAAEARALPAVSVAAPDCAGLDATVLGRAVALELKARLVAADDPAVAAQVSLRCDAERILVDLVDPATGKHSDRVLDGLTLPLAARPRLVALAVVELVTASWVEAALFPEPAVQPLAPKPAAPEIRAVVLAAVSPRLAREPSALRISALAACAGAFGETGPLCGGGLRAGGEHLRGLSWSTDLFALHGERTAAIGDIELDLVALGARLGYGARLGRVVLRIEGGARGGAVRFAGRADPGASGSSIWRPTGGPVAGVGVSVAATRWLLVETSIEAGWMARSASALVETPSGRQVGAAVDGGFVLGALGIGLRP